MSSTSKEYRVWCESCHLDEEFPTQEHANTMQVYHDAVFDCEEEAIKEEL